MKNKGFMRVLSRLMSVLILVTGLQLQLPALVINAEDISTLIQQYSENMKKIDSGAGFTIAITSDGRVAAWGDNSQHQCDVPSNLDHVVAVSAGGYHALALKSDGTVVAWGLDDSGQCDVPADLKDPAKAHVLAISGGGSHSLALKSDGTVVAWGFDLNGQCTVPDSLKDSSTANVTAIAAGGFHSLALKSDGTVVAWGDNGWNECDVPADLTDVAAIAAPWAQSLAIKKDGTVVAWGHDYLKQLDIPGGTKIGGATYGLSNVVAVSGSFNNSMALKSDGTVVAWGGDDVGEYASSIYAPPADLSGVSAISSQSKGCVVLKTDNTLVSWGQTGVTSGTSLVAGPKITTSSLESGNKYIDVNFNSGIYGANNGTTPVSAANFQLTYNTNGGDAANVTVSSITKLDGTTPPQGGETSLRFFLDVTGIPNGLEIIEIKPAAGHPIYDSSGKAMDAGRTTGQINLNTTVLRIASAQMAPDNSYMDVNFNLGAYGNDIQSSAVRPENFNLYFAKNSGSASGVSISSITGSDGVTPLYGGETTVRFHLVITGAQSGDETIEIKPSGDQSIYTNTGTPMAASQTTGAIRLSPPKPAIVSAQLAANNSYFDVTFNTGVYGNKRFVNESEIGDSAVTTSNLRLAFMQWGGGASGMFATSIRKPDSTIEASATPLNGGEKTLRIFLTVTGSPTGLETAAIWTESVFNSLGVCYSQGAGDVPTNTTHLNTMTPGIGLAELAQNNRYVDVNFTAGLYGDAAAGTPVTASDFQMIYNKNTGNTGNVTISSISKTDSTVESKASPLTGGEKKIRFFLNMTDPAAGSAETIEIKPLDDNSLYSFQGAAMISDETTHIINLFPSSPQIISAQLAPDNSYLDVNFDFGVYGDSSHSSAVTADNFFLQFYGGQTIAATVKSVKKNNSAVESSALALTGGETTLRFFLDITGIPNGQETILINTRAAAPLYNSLGIPSTNQMTDEIRLNAAAPVITSAQLGNGSAYVDISLNVGVYGDNSHLTPVKPANFKLLLNKNGSSVYNISINSIKKNNNADEAKASALTGGENTVRVFLNITGVINGNETIEIIPADNNSVWNSSGGAMAADQTTGAINLSVKPLEIVSTRLAEDDGYLDVTFSTGAYGKNDGSTPAAAANFRLVFASNGGNNYPGSIISSVRKTDSTDESSASPLAGGETTLRFFFSRFIGPMAAPTGVETIEILSANSAGGPRVYNKSGTEMSLTQTTRVIKLNDGRPRIQAAVLSADSSYLDIHFTEGLYGDTIKKTYLTPADFNITFSKNGGTATGVSISSIKKDDSTDENAASPLLAGDSTLRFFLKITGSPSGEETIVVSPKTAGYIIDSKLNPLQASQTTGAIKLNLPAPAIVSAVMGDDNAYLDLTFSTGMYGDISHALPILASSFAVNFHRNGGTATNLVITSVRKNDSVNESSASQLTGGEKTVRFFFSLWSYSGRTSGTETFEITAAKGQPIYTASSIPLGDASSGTVKLISSTPEFVSTRMAEGSKYVDVTFNTGVYGFVNSGLGPVSVNNFLYDFRQNGGGASNVYVSSLKMPDSEIESTASPLIGGEKTVRFFLNVTGIPTGDEAFAIVPRWTDANNKIYSRYYMNMSTLASTGAIKLLAPSLKFVSVSAPQLAGAKLQYVDVNFGSGAYGDNVHASPLAPADFRLDFSNTDSGGSSASIMAVTKPDNIDPARATALQGGEATVRFFIQTDYTTSGSESIIINPMSQAVFNSSGNAMPESLATNSMKLLDSAPRIVSTQMGAGNAYIDVNFSAGMYTSLSNNASSLDPVSANDFSLVFRRNSGGASSAYLYRARKPDSIDSNNASLLTGGETTVRFFLVIGGVPSGVETIEVKSGSAWLHNRDGAFMPIGATTGQIKLYTPYPPSWSGSSQGEPLGWMSDTMISAGYEATLVMKNNGTVTAFGDNISGACSIPAGLSGVKAVSTGWNFSIALKRNGTVAGWGGISIPAGISGVRAISAGNEAAFILKDDNTVALIGNNYYKYDYANNRNYYVSQLDIPCGTSTITAISAGQDDHLLVLKSDGTVAAFDYNQISSSNAFGQCSVPDGLVNVKAVAAGNGYSLALKTDGTVVGWGNVLLPAGGLSNVAAISAGGYGYSVLKSDGTVEVYDKSGNAENNIKSMNLKGIIAISAGDSHYAAIRENGDVVVWWDELNFNDHGQLNMPQGLNIFQNIIKVSGSGYIGGVPYVDLSFRNSPGSTYSALGVYGPVGSPNPLKAGNLKVYITKGSQSLFDVSISSVKKSSNYYEVSAPDLTGGETTIRVFLKFTGISSGTETIEIRPATSFSAFDSSGDNLLASQTSGPITLSKVEAQKYSLYESRLDAGWSHALAMKEKGAVFNWGDNTYGQAPVMLSQDNASQVSAGYHHSVILLHDGTVKVWGENYYGQLNVPNTLKNILQVSAGGYHTLALNTTGFVTAWGDNFYGQCTVPGGLSGVVKLAAGGHHSLALKSDGTVVAWGDNHFKQCDVPAGLTGVISITAGEDYSLALKSNGTVVAWGANGKGQISLPASLTGVKAVSAGYRHSLAIKADGTVVAWGDNSKGQCNVPSGLTGVVAVSAGAYFSLALKEDGTVLAWGDNSSGQSTIPFSVMPPKIVSATLAQGNTYVDILFNKGINSLSDGTGALVPGSFSLTFKSNPDLGGASGVTIKSIKQNDSMDEAKASALTGGEMMVRVFLTVTGSAKGTETIELKPAGSGAIYDMYGAPMWNDQSTGLITLSNQEPLEDIDIKTDHTSVQPGALENIPIYDQDTHALLYTVPMPAENAQRIEWQHKLDVGAGNNRMVLVGLYSRETNHYSQDIYEVDFGSKKMTFAGTAAAGDIKLDIYYMLDRDLPYRAGDYTVMAYYKGGNAYIEGHAVSLYNVAQQGPENIATAAQPNNNAWSQLGTGLKTLTDKAMVVDFTGKSLITSINKTAGAVRTNEEYRLGIWAEIAVSIRNVMFPVSKPSVTVPAPTPDLPSDDSIAFEKKDLGFNAVPMKIGNKIAAVGDTQIRVSDDGENWGSANPHPKGSIYSAGGKLFNFDCKSSLDSVTIKSSADGINWTDVNCSLPNVVDINDGGAAYTYEGSTSIVDIAAYVDPDTNITTYIAVGNAWVAQYDSPTHIKVNGDGGFPWTYETSVKIWLTSRDSGATWTASFIPDFNFLKEGCIISVYGPRKFQKVICNNNGVFVAYDSQTVYYSTDMGASWTEGKSFKKDSSGNLQNPYYNHITGIFIKNNTLVMTGTGLDTSKINIYWSTDGTVWNDAEIGYSDPVFLTYDKYARTNTWSYSTSFNNMAYAQNTFASINGKTLAASKDGKKWDIYSVDYDSPGLEVFNDKFFRSIGFKDVNGLHYWLLSSDNLKDWYVENKDYSGGGFLYLAGKVYGGSTDGHIPFQVGYVPLSIELEAPKDGDIHVPVNSTLTLSFTDAIKPGSTYNSITLKDSSGSSVPVTINLDGENKTIGITPRADLNPLKKYTLVIPEGALKDITDSKVNKTVSIGFTTGTSDLPAVTGTNIPASGGIAADSRLEICYSREILQGAQVQYDKITIASKDDPAHPVSISKEISGSKLIIKPAINLDNSRIYTVTVPINAIQDTFYNEAAAWSMDFTVSSDQTPPVVESTDPVNLGERVQTDKPISIVFSEEVQQGDGFGGIKLKDIRSDSNTAIESKLSTAAGIDGIRRTTLEIYPGTELELHKTYSVFIPANAVRDNGGNIMAGDFSLEFTEEIEKSYPVLISASPGNNETNVDLRGMIVLTYDRPIKVADAVNMKLQHYDDVYRDSVNITTEVKDNKLYIIPNLIPDDDNPNNDMTYGMHYRFRILGQCISDLYGNVDPDPLKEYTIDFTLETQKVVSSYPAPDAAGVPLNSCVAVKLDPAFTNSLKGLVFNNVTLARVDTVNGNKVYTDIAARVMLNGDTLLIAPEEDLNPNTSYSVEIPRGAVTNQASLVNNYYTFGFTTGAAAAQADSFDISGGLEIGDALQEGDTASFSAAGSIAGATGYCWDFGDGTFAPGANASHIFTYRGDYYVFLAVTGGDGSTYITRKLVSILKRPDASSITLDVSPQDPAAVSGGGTADLIVTLKSGNNAIKNAPIAITRTYPLADNRPPEPLATVYTDNNGHAAYRATLPEGIPEYYVTFTFSSQYNGVGVKKEVRRILRNAVGKVDISGYVKDDRNAVQANAIVLVGTKSVTTDKNGFYSITGLDVGTYAMRVSSNMHYDSTASISLAQKSTVMNITLTKLSPTGNPFVRQVYINDTASGPGKNFYFLQGVDAAIQIFALIDWNGHDPGYTEFNLNGTIYNEANMRLALNAANLKQGDKLTVSCITADGVRSAAMDARINIISSLPSEFPATLHPTYIGGKYIIDEYISLTGINTPNITSIPVIEGGPISFLTQPAHATGVMNLDGTLHVFVGKSTDISAYGYYAQNNILQKYYAKQNAVTDAEKAEIASRQSRSYMGSVEMNGTLDASFYWYYVPSIGMWLYKDGSLHLGIDADVYGKSSWGIPGTPVSLYLGGEFRVLMDAYLMAGIKTGGTGYDLGTLDFKDLHLEIFGGADAYVASASVHFSGDGKVKIKFDYPQETDYFIEVKGWVKLTALIWSVNLPFLDYSWGDNSPWSGGSSPLALKSLRVSAANSTGNVLPSPSTDDFELMDRDYLNDQSNWSPDSSGNQNGAGSGGMMRAMALSQASGSSDTTTLRSNTFPNTDHKIIPYDNGSFMVLVEDDPARSSVNRTRALYSIYDGKSWSAPLPIDPNDKTADSKPVAARTNDGVISAWENLKDVLPDNADLEDALAGEEICVGKYNSSTGTWTGTYNLTSDSYLDYSPRIAASGNKGILVWTKSKSEDYSTMFTGDYSAINDIMFSSWDGSVFSTPKAVATMNKPIAGSSIAFNGSTGIYTFAVDGDNDLNTTEDQEIYMMTYNGSVWSSPVKLTNNNVKDSDPQVAFVNDKAFLVWDQDGKIVYIPDALANTSIIKVGLDRTILHDTFTMTKSEDGTIALVGPGGSGGGQELYAVTYDQANDVWSGEMTLTSDNSLDSCPSAVFTGNKLITVYNRTQILSSINPNDGQEYSSAASSADLMMTALELKHDLAVFSEGMTLSENNPSPGSLVTINAVVENNGTYTETGVQAAFYIGDPQAGGKQIGTTQVINAAIAPGAAGTASVQWEVPAGVASGDIYVVADPGNRKNDMDRSNNTAYISVLQPDLELTALECAPAGSGSYAVKVKVSNIGAANVSDAVVTLYYGDSNNEMQLIGTIDAGALKAGEVVELPYLWTPAANIFLDGKVSLFATVDIPSGATVSMLAANALQSGTSESALENNVRMLTVNQQSLDIVSYEPADRQVNVGVDKAITITFSGLIDDKNTDYANIKLTGPGNAQINITKDINGDTLTIQPVQPLQYETDYTLLIPKKGIEGTDGCEPAADWSISFKTESNTAYPLIQSLNSVPVNSTISLPFSRDVNRGTDFDSIVCKDSGGQKVSCTFTYLTNVLYIKPDAPLGYVSSYTVSVPAGGLKDSNGTDINAFSLRFTTQDNSSLLDSLTLSVGQLNPVFDPGVTNYTVNLTTHQENIVVTAAPKVVTSVVTVAGSLISGGQSKTITLNTGTNHIVVAVKGEDDNKCAYNITVTNPSKASGGSGNSGGASPASTATIEAGAYKVSIQVITEKGITTASLKESDLNEAFGKVEADSDGARTVSIAMPKIQGTGSYVLQVPAAVLSSDDADRKIEMISDVGIITLPGNMLEGMELENIGDVGISIGKADVSNLPKDVQNMLGSRPVIELKLTAGDRTIAWNNPDAPVTVSVPYKPTAEELKDPEHITVWYIDGSGNAAAVPSGRYDPATGKVTFSTTHFSEYAVTFVKKTFSDISKFGWAKNQIEVLASKGIIPNLSGTTFNPSTNITRADFLVMLIRTLNLTAKVDGNFSDVKPGDYYYEAVGIAKKLGVSDGVGNNRFDPKASITRQDMATLVARALRVADKLKTKGTISDMKRFTDKGKIASYAVEAMAAMVREGLLEGDSNMIDPVGNTTRAEMAVLMYRVYNKYKG